MSHNHHLVAGTAGGTVLSVLPAISSADVIKTAILAIVGAIVSFTVSLLLKKFINPRKK